MAPKKKQKDEVRQFEISDFIPYACHYSPETILTKNGELVQFIKFDGDGGYPDPEFREAVREAINSTIDPSRHAVWIHTVRTREKPKSLTANDFSKVIELEWRNNLPSKIHYDNCIYISILHDSSRFRPLKPLHFLRALTYKTEMSYRNRYLADAFENLTATVDKMAAALSKFGSKRLQIYEENGNYYSEPMEFLHRILSFFDDHIPLPLGDLSQNLIPNEIDFNTYTGHIELKSKTGPQFGTIITLKESARLPARALDEFLNMDSEIVVSQALEFSTSNMQLHKFEYQKYMSSIEGDRDFGKLSGLDGLNLGNPDAFAVEQTNIIIMQPTREKLLQKLVEIHDMLSLMGIVPIIEDLRVERTFWSILPGNFAFLRRQNLITRKDIANFANLGNDIFDISAPSLFRGPMMFFENSDGEPYPFHLISEAGGNGLVISANPEERIAMLHLLAIHAKRAGGKVIYYDAHGTYKKFADSIKADYMSQLDLDLIKESIGSKRTVIILNSIQHLLDNHGIEFFVNFAKYVTENEAVILTSVSPEMNCQALLVDFETQIYFSTKIDDYADNFDLYDDEIEVIGFLGKDNIYVKHNNEEMVLKFDARPQFRKSLLTGNLP